ncbi:MAG: hypothetical protein LRZ85_09445 [Alphaproteobacteria bacterium]|nr:hypothetical protein [Alphaproteobacteria bacterium]
MLKRTYADPDLKAMPLESFEPSSLSLSILQAVYESTYLNCFLVGGALRSEFMGAAPRDYDVHLFPHAPIRMSTAEALKNIRQSLRQIPHMQEIGGRNSLASQYGVLRYKFRNAHDIDIVVHREPRTLENMAMYGDATINAIAMDKDGKTLCHPKMPEHIRDEVYAIRVTGEYTARALKRFHKRSDRFGHFQLMPPEEYAKTL